MAENSSENKTLSKLDLDRPQDFRFHIAYKAYSQAWEDNTSESVRVKLNELLSSLANDENGYSSFYAQIEKYRKDLTPFRSGNTRIETQRKRAWQESDTRDRRNRRHK
jgi:hypothetical protein